MVRNGSRLDGLIILMDFCSVAQRERSWSIDVGSGTTNSILAKKPSTVPPAKVVWAAPEVVGKLVELVWPVK